MANAKTKFKEDMLGMYDPQALKYAPWNPKRRIDATNRAFMDLVASIRQHGQFMPCIINEHGLVIDGNRRVAVCAVLGKPVECIVRAKADPFTIYQVVNDVRSQITGDQIVEIFTKEPRALGPVSRRKTDHLAKTFGGIDKLNMYINSDFTWETASSATYIARAVGYFMPKREITAEHVWTLVEWTRQHDQRPSGLRMLKVGRSKKHFGITLEEYDIFLQYVWKDCILSGVGFPKNIGRIDSLYPLYAAWLSTSAPHDLKSRILPQMECYIDGEKDWNKTARICDQALRSNGGQPWNVK